MEYLGKNVRTRLELIAEGETTSVHTRSRHNVDVRKNKDYTVMHFKDRTVIHDGITDAEHVIPEVCTVVTSDMGASLVLRGEKHTYYDPHFAPVQLPGVLRAKVDLYFVLVENHKVHVYDTESEKLHTLKGELMGSVIHASLLLEVYNTASEKHVRCLLSGKIIYSTAPANPISVDGNVVHVQRHGTSWVSYYRVTREVKHVPECCICFAKLKKITHAFPVCGHTNICAEHASMDTCPTCAKSGPAIRLFI
jgi:hypothetical protein